MEKEINKLLTAIKYIWQIGWFIWGLFGIHYGITAILVGGIPWWLILLNFAVVAFMYWSLWLLGIGPVYKENCPNRVLPKSKNKK